tara:strand:+ start:213 stop:779 length:567 start_codon:yes stop_codon:yes gene_type:complete
MLPDFDITAAEVQQLLADTNGHGLSNYLIEHASHFVMTGGNLRTPFRILWYAENLGLTREIHTRQHKDSQAVSLREILSQINRSNELNGKRPVTLSTVVNGLSPMAKTLLNAFKVKVLINRQEETIKLLSEAFAANLFSNMRADAERVFKRYADVTEQANAVGVDTKGLIAASPEVSRFILAANSAEG